jgi:sarcosine oxidase subunit alpha
MPDGHLRLRDVERGTAIHLLVNGEPVGAFEGETVAAALLATGRRTLRHTNLLGQARGLFCVMGVCFDCVVEIDGRTGVRACMTPVRDGMRVEVR